MTPWSLAINNVANTQPIFKPTRGRPVVHMTDDDLKPCSKCGELKDIKKEYRYQPKVGRFTSECRACEAARQKADREKRKVK